MNARKNAIISGLMKTTFAVLAAALLAAANAETARAQSLTPPPPPPPTLSYSFNVPVVKAVPNPCFGGFELVTGNQGITITTTQGASGFSIGLSVNSSGRGEDALADGTLILDGTQHGQYLYSSTSDTKIDFPTLPGTADVEIPITDYLSRAYGPAETFAMQTVLSISFVNGVPSAPVLKGIAVGCQ